MLYCIGLLDDARFKRIPIRIGAIDPHACGCQLKKKKRIAEMSACHRHTCHLVISGLGPVIMSSYMSVGMPSFLCSYGLCSYDLCGYGAYVSVVVPSFPRLTQTQPVAKLPVRPNRSGDLCQRPSGSCHRSFTSVCSYGPIQFEQQIYHGVCIYGPCS